MPRPPCGIDRAKLDRLARNTKFLLTIAEGTGDGRVVFADLPQIPLGAMGKFFITLMAAVVELEAGLISQRTKAALAIAKARGVKLGNPRLRTGECGGGDAGRAMQTARSRAHAELVQPYITAARGAGASSLREVAAALTARGVQPPSGGDRWDSSQVRRIERATRVH
jgi:DNA invertase Pin-like site-specific DNA recombinase